MSFGKHSRGEGHRGRGPALRAALMTLAACLVLFSVIGGSLAWLTARTDPVVNVFTYGDIRITLTETKGEVLSDGRYFKMTPGKTIEKDTKISVLADSEACWLFVEIRESGDKALGDYIEYAVADGWTALQGTPGVYFRATDASAEDKVFSVLKNDEVKVKDSVTGEMLRELHSGNYPRMTVTGYAVQRDADIDAIDSAAEAWALIGPGGS